MLNLHKICMKIHSVVPMKMFSLRFAPRFSGSCWRTECADLHLRNHNHLRLMSLRMCVCPSSWSFPFRNFILKQLPNKFHNFLSTAFWTQGHRHLKQILCCIRKYFSFNCSWTVRTVGQDEKVFLFLHNFFFSFRWTIFTWQIFRSALRPWQFAFVVTLQNKKKNNIKRQQKLSAAGTVLLTGATSANCHRFLFTFATVVFGEFSTKHFTFPFCNNFACCTFKWPHSSVLSTSDFSSVRCWKNIRAIFHTHLIILRFGSTTLRMRYV